MTSLYVCLAICSKVALVSAPKERAIPAKRARLKEMGKDTEREPNPSDEQCTGYRGASLQEWTRRSARFPEERVGPGMRAESAGKEMLGRNVLGRETRPESPEEVDLKTGSQEVEDTERPTVRRRGWKRVLVSVE